MGFSVVSVLFTVRLVGASVGLPVNGSDMYKSRRKLGLPVLYVKERLVPRPESLKRERSLSSAEKESVMATWQRVLL